MAISVTCDMCNKPIHTDPDERKFRMDFCEPKFKQGFDVCEECYLKMRALIRGRV